MSVICDHTVKINGNGIAHTDRNVVLQTFIMGRIKRVQTSEIHQMMSDEGFTGSDVVLRNH